MPTVIALMVACVGSGPVGTSIYPPSAKVTRPLRLKLPRCLVIIFGGELHWLGVAYHWGLMPANLITLAHFSVSSAMNLVNSVIEVENGTAPMFASRALILGSTRAAFTSRLSRSTISGGVALGAQSPHQPLAAKPGMEWH
jgi:hypothetical protein